MMFVDFQHEGGPSRSPCGRNRGRSSPVAGTSPQGAGDHGQSPPVGSHREKKPASSDSPFQIRKSLGTGPDAVIDGAVVCGIADKRAVLRGNVGALVASRFIWPHGGRDNETQDYRDNCSDSDNDDTLHAATLSPPACTLTPAGFCRGSPKIPNLNAAVGDALKSARVSSDGLNRHARRHWALGSIPDFGFPASGSGSTISGRNQRLQTGRAAARTRDGHRTDDDQ